MPFISAFIRVFLLLGSCSSVLAQKKITIDKHLTSFETRPEIKAPRWTIKTNHLDKVAPGYWFVAPYHELSPTDASDQKWDSCQIGPHIYDKHGGLVWSGACRYHNRNVFDFKSNRIDGKDYLSMLVRTGPRAHKIASGLILNNTYGQEHNIVVHPNANRFNVHDFNMVDGGKSVLSVFSIPKKAKKKMRESYDLPKPSFILTNGFREFKVQGHKKLFEWNSIDHVLPNETTFPPPPKLVIHRPGWDYIHLNSLDKFDNGDYLLSSRYMNTIYRVDGTTGDIVWRFGGERSDFVLDGFNFSRQHHARILETNQTHIQLSFLDNAAGGAKYDPAKPTMPYSRGLFVSLQTSSTPMRATLLRHYDRPDGELSEERGNVQQLDNGNVFVCWSGNGYFSEHTRDGEVVLEASFATGPRMNSYRGYKYEFVGRPTEAPVVKASAYGATSGTITTVMYVSWNGDTEVAEWRFYEKTKKGSDEEALIGSSTRSGFETMNMYSGYAKWVIAEGVDKDGEVLRRSRPHRTVTPDDWQAAGYEDDQSPKPEKPTHEEPEHDDDDDADHDDFDEDEDEEVESDIEDEDDDDHSNESTTFSPSFDPFVILILIGLTGASVAFVIWLMRRRRRTTARPTFSEDDTQMSGDDDDGDRDYYDIDDYANSVKLEQMPLRRHEDHDDIHPPSSSRASSMSDGLMEETRDSQEG